jgi:hypothetical protein
MKIKSLYCGGGFIDSQLLWLIIVIDGYCNKNNIRNIIFERKLDKEILKKKKITRILKKYNIIYLKDSLMLKHLLIQILSTKKGLITSYAQENGLHLEPIG